MDGTIQNQLINLAEPSKPLSVIHINGSNTIKLTSTTAGNYSWNRYSSDTIYLVISIPPRHALLLPLLPRMALRLQIRRTRHGYARIVSYSVHLLAPSRKQLYLWFNMPSLPKTLGPSLPRRLLDHLAVISNS